MVLEAHHPNHSVLEHAKTRMKILWMSKCIPKSSRQRPVKTVPYRLPHLPFFEENRTLTFSIQVQTPQKEWKKNRIAKSETFLCPPWRCLQASQDQRQDGESSPRSQNNTPGGSWKSLYYPTLSTSPKVPASRRSRARSSGCGPARVV